MKIEDLFGLIIFVVLIIWVVYNLIYWTVLAWFYPDKLKKWNIDYVKQLPKWFPFKSNLTKNTKKRSVWPARLIMLFINTMFILFFVMVFILENK